MKVRDGGEHTFFAVDCSQHDVARASGGRESRPMEFHFERRAGGKLLSASEWTGERWTAADISTQGSWRSALALQAQKFGERALGLARHSEVQQEAVSGRPKLANLERGRYTGVIQPSSKAAGIEQHIGRGVSILHHRDTLSRVPAVGERVTIQYRDGRGTVQSRERGKEHGRAR